MSEEEKLKCSCGNEIWFKVDFQDTGEIVCLLCGEVVAREYWRVGGQYVREIF